MNAEPLLTLVARLLAARKLDAVLIGNAAAAIQGSPVTTMDLDFMFRKTPANLTKLKRLADDLDAVVLSPFYPASQRYRITRGAWGSRSVIKPKAISYGASWSVRPSSALPPPPEKLGNLHQRPSGLLEMAATATAERSPTERHERLDRLAETIARAHFNPEEPFDPSGLRTAALNYAEGAVSMTADQLLTHYTTDGGLRGILDSGVIWATRTRDQSDHREVEYRNGLIWHASQALPRLSAYP